MVSKEQNIADRVSLSELHTIMQKISEMGRIHAESFKEYYGENWKTYDTHGYVTEFLEGKFQFHVS